MDSIYLFVLKTFSSSHRDSYHDSANEGHVLWVKIDRLFAYKQWQEISGLDARSIENIAENMYVPGNILPLIEWNNIIKNILH